MSTCKNPYMNGSLAFGCGQCLPCRINRRRLWTHRLLLESMLHGDNSFVTLTYSNDNNPFGTLHPHHVTRFLKRLRKFIKIRYYLVGEYGDETERPHYHAALFGYPQCLRGQTDHRLNSCCIPCDRLKKIWGLGGIDIRGLGVETAQYLAGYVTKKMTNKNDSRLKGRYPERAWMSRKPGLGAHAMNQVCNDLLGYLPDGDVPLALGHGKKKLPLGRYLRKKMREIYEMENTDAQEGWQKYQIENMQKLYEKYEINPRFARFSNKQALLQKENESKIVNIENKHKIFSTKGKL